MSMGFAPLVFCEKLGTRAGDSRSKSDVSCRISEKMTNCCGLLSLCWAKYLTGKQHHSQNIRVMKVRLQPGAAMLPGLGELVASSPQALSKISRISRQ